MINDCSSLSHLRVAVEEVLEVVLLAQHRLRNDVVVVDARDWRERSLIGHSQPRHLLRLLVVVVVQLRSGVDRDDLVAGTT